MSLENNIFSMVLFSHDYYMLYTPNYLTNDSTNDFLLYKNLADFKNRKVKLAPVIRLYGTNKSGVKTCLHIHGFFPYFYINFEDFKEINENKEKLNEFLNRFGDALELSFNKAFRSNFTHAEENKFYVQFIIYKLSVIFAKDFYGFHEKKVCFLKIEVYDPKYLKDIIKILESGAVLNRNFQVYEGHINYFMHFYSDCNLSGMSEIKVMGFKFRKTNFIENWRFVKKNKNLSDFEEFFDSCFDLREFWLNRKDFFSNLEKTSVCCYEIDTHFSNILNIFEKEIGDNNEFSDGIVTKALEYLWRDEKMRRKLFNIEELMNYVLRKGDLDEFQMDLLIKNDDFFKEIEIKNNKNNENININNYNNDNNVCNKEIILNNNLLINFKEIKEKEKSEIYKSFENRYKTYKIRKKESQMYNITIDEEDLEDENSISEEISDILSYKENINKETPNVFFTKKPIKIEKDFASKNKYQAAKKIKKKILPYFDSCKYCKKYLTLCTCVSLKKMKKSSNFNENLQNYSENPYKKNLILFKSAILPPTQEEVLKDLHEKNSACETVISPFYSNYSDIFLHYDFPIIKQCSLFKMQLFCRDMIQLPINRQFIISIRNSLQLPSSIETFFTKDYENNSLELKAPNNYINNNSTNRSFYKFYKTAPKISEVVTDMNFKKESSVFFRQMSNYSDFYSYISPFKKKTSICHKGHIENVLENKYIFDLTTLSFEIFAKSKPGFKANPEKDYISSLFFSVNNEKQSEKCRGVIIYEENEFDLLKNYENKLKIFYNLSDIDEIIVTKSENELINTFLMLVFKTDPDIVSVYDVEQGAMFFLVVRAKSFGIDLVELMGRSQKSLNNLFKNSFVNEYYKESSVGSVVGNSWDKIESLTFEKNKNEKNNKEKNFINFNNFQIEGRIVLNVWRIARGELKLTNYDLENVIFQVFGKREPVFSNWTLSEWYCENKLTRSRVFKYFLNRLYYSEEFLAKIDLIPKLCEMSRFYGVDPNSVLQRGTQFKIEAVLNRVTKAHGYLLLSASRTQIAKQNPLKSIPMVIEPPKSIFLEPVVVLDFQSLYPSIMIAYNMCYSTCLGTFESNFRSFGENITNYDKKDLFLAPSNVLFVKKHIREGIIPKILKEFLSSRIMIKKSSTLYQGLLTIQKLLEFRQLALKFFMNFLYGYTGASFSGRMPASDLADSVVETGRTMLKKCISYIENKSIWKAKVIYGDTDSLFVLLKGRSVEQATELGKAIARRFPSPIELKFEKVYCPVVLCAKKRYVGMKWDKGSGQIESKGIETVRRDGCAAVSKILMKCIGELFEKRNLSNIKDYLYKQWTKIKNNHVNIKDFIIAKEIKLGFYREELLPPWAIVAREREKKDPMLKAKYGERIGYLVVKGPPNSRVKDLVVSIEDFLENNKTLNSEYYIEKLINPALFRIFSCVDVDISLWYGSIPNDICKKNFVVGVNSLKNYYNLQACVICSAKSQENICEKCKNNWDVAVFLLNKKKNYLKNDLEDLENICKVCSRLFQESDRVPCREFNCSVFYGKINAEKTMKKIGPIIEKYLKENFDK